ncbi:MAG: GFA family protein [Acidiferrobacterales bacterium]
MITGSCLCRAVRFEIDGKLRRFVHCHCQTCRKIHGTVYGSSALVGSEDFRLVAGADAITVYESSPGKERCFCRVCGSHVFARFASQPQDIILRIGTLDTDPGERPTAHIWLCHKAPWYQVVDALARYDEGFPT